MITIHQLMEANRNRAPISIWQEESVWEALKRMAKNNVGALIVVDESNRMVGIFTERDYARKVALMGRTSLETRIKEIMSVDIITIDVEQTLEDGIALMTEHHIRHLPVKKAGNLVGMVSARDIMAAIILKKEELIDDLQRYIWSEEYHK